ncbi:hypothetical protein [Streptomyces sp. NPDC005423]|uniref:hypothetical protein n=1 Tax=Streptomyces sp. NPDC005423 TaxID=3155343 RepID=UPI0033AC1D8E
MRRRRGSAALPSGPATVAAARPGGAHAVSASSSPSASTAARRGSGCSLTVVHPAGSSVAANGRVTGGGLKYAPRGAGWTGAVGQGTWRL